MEKSVYEKDAISEIHEWKNPKLTWFDSALEKINYPLEKAGEFVLDAPITGGNPNIRATRGHLA